MNTSQQAVTRGTIHTLCLTKDSFLERFPESLWASVPAPEPQALWLKGTSRGLDLLGSLPEDGLAVVGTRGPQPRSELLVRQVLSEIARARPLAILSGLARGIDTCAHQAALELRLPTLAILGAGFAQPLPAVRAHLLRAILEADGVLVSEYAPEFPALRHHFLARNRLIAGWSAATWVVEAGQRSGALNTARWARESGRPVFATPAFPGDPWFAGNLALLGQVDSPARPLISAQHLGAQWLSLTTAPVHPTRELPSLRTPLGKLMDRVSQAQFFGGGLGTHALLNWALEQGWTPELFFETLERALNSGEVIEKHGVIQRLSATSPLPQSGGEAPRA
jgi:DNA protecting protein DprA